MKISVLIAVYNGELYIKKQLESVLSQLGEDDEVIISDDNPSGGTFAVVEPFLGDKRIRYVHGPAKGVDANNEFLLRECTGDVAFLCDQDDVWLDCKVERVMSAIEGGACCVLHNAYITDENLEKSGITLFEDRGAKTGILHNIIKNCYTGACMALTRQAFTAALPFPKNLPMHDQWLGLVSEKVGRVDLVDEPLLLYRRNPGSMTGGKTSLMQKIRWRINIVRSIVRYKGN
ncbi:MAG: glycosyltransferase [Clostridia bacterium]|nr:glycosyltransferase [Clostridia bacterium]